MTSLNPNIGQAASQDPCVTESEVWANETHKEFGARIVKNALEGLNRFSREKAAAKAAAEAVAQKPSQAA